VTDMGELCKRIDTERLAEFRFAITGQVLETLRDECELDGLMALFALGDVTIEFGHRLMGTSMTLALLDELRRKVLLMAGFRAEPERKPQ
jgi:hypothetical protein